MNKYERVLGRFSLPTDCVFICFGKKSIGLKAVGEIDYNTAVIFKR